MKWEKVKIYDIGKVITGKTPSTNVAENFGNDVPFITPRDMIGNRLIISTERYLSSRGATTVKNCILPEDSVCVSCIGSDMGKVVITTTPSVTNQQINSIIVKENNDYRFFYYSMINISKAIKSLGKNATAVPILNKSKFSDIEINLPPLPIQTRIAHILSAYDNLIENNQKQIKLLEEVAMRLYKEWFVNLRFPGYENTSIVDGVPEGWQIGLLGDFIKVNAQNIGSKYPHDYIQYVDIGSVRNGKIEQKSHYKRTDAPGRAKRLASDGDTIWGMVRPNLKAYAMILNPGETDVFSTGFAVLTPEQLPYTFLHCFVTQDDFVGYLVNCTNGAAYPAVKPIHFEEAKVIVPSDELLQKFHSLTNPSFRKINILDKQINFLRQARDKLLPKLMSGEIEA